MNLDELFKLHGDFRICFMYNNICTKWVLYSEATQEQKQRANLRELTADEIVLDSETLDDLQKTMHILGIEMELSYDSWNTGSRGFHIHLFFKELKKFNEMERKLAREWFIKEFNCDLAKKSGVIAIENRPHFKTGKLKTLIKHFERGENLLPDDCLDYVREKEKPLPRTSQGCPMNCRLIDYALQNKLTEDSGRGAVLCKNAAIYFIQHHKGDEQNLNNALYHAQEKPTYNGWLHWAKGKSDFSCAELRKWLRDSGQENIEQMTCWRCAWQKK